ncbi:MAG: YybH family protein [Bryobacteraceae bacterium]
MRKISVLAALFGAVLLGQQVSPEEEKEWVEVRKIKTLYEQAVSNNQIDKLQPYLAKNFRGVVLTGEEVKSFDDLKAVNLKIRQLIGSGGTYSVKVNYAPGVMFGNVAVAHGNTEDTVVTGGGKRFEFQTLWTVDLVKEPDGWKLFRIHSSIDPVNNVFVQDTVYYSKIFYGGGGALLGLIVGVVIRGMMGKR